ncbi:hypothetical protein MGG_04023 [Pyricularia oryzae 70-15]|uniref:Small ribosomal subunit protein mS41 n=4 Tax=Pyricularia oryzae TaxID=318829 RepID=G4NGU6_PYRO7|nr:uncharacterized protein MGG_04023 [Pyricularia oryzae 70-15]ELQ39160.1 hypothetical protein OOU_Y34scaffold00514g77 [Pyricularia oryzae Y34]KAI6512322.1 hypothetical protein MCOR13_000124 [Pyricularia oryzae]EHA47456.1 hypothetical protein MGG_04023 [Pyricularia oryzae 70-15]KAI6590627.1 hypothetical protein MCOR12_008364 [Pyricularia oryzae]KAI6644894.1 hypothetical protein MCOR14_000738 [Pyricularia oryzae]
MPPSKTFSFLSSLLRSRPTTASIPSISPAIQSRWVSSKRTFTIPEPIPLVPDVPTFLRLIGRDLVKHASKFPSWEALFSLTPPQLRELGIEPARSRRYLISWRNKYTQGHFGIGGDLKHVVDGAAELKVLNIPKGPLKTHRVVVNVPPGTKPEDVPEKERPRIQGYKVIGTRTIAGPHAVPMKNHEGSIFKAVDGLWEHKRGRKIDGGERRRAEVRFKRRVEERKAMRESQGFNY